MKFKAYHKIRQFKDVVRDIRFRANFKYIHEGTGEPVYEETEKPVITFIGTVKLHGTNAQVCFDGKKLLAGKRSSLIGIDALQEHFGFNAFVQVRNKEYFLNLMSELYSKHCKEGQQIILYGEFAGQGIQKGVGISELKKSFYIFEAKVYDINTDKSEWLDISAWDFSDGDSIYNINQFPTYKIDIDFNNPGNVQNRLVEITESVERECPVSKALGVENSIGEGVVWTGFWKNEKYIFKVKGDAHAGKSKVKQLKPVDNEKLQKINDTVDKLTPIWRLNQVLTDVFKLNEGGFLERKKIGDYIKSVIKDIVEEETLTIKESGLEFKELTKSISTICKNYFFEQESTF